MRHYRRGGTVASLLGDRYLRGRVPRPVREFRMLQEAAALGIPTAPVVGAAVYPSGPWYRGDLVTEWVESSRDLAAVLFRRLQFDSITPDTVVPERRSEDEEASAMECTGRVVRLLHERGVVHPDLNIKNILVAPGDDGPRALIIDLDRARRMDGPVPPRVRRRMLDRFARSVRKWERRTGQAAVPDWLEAFRDGYDASPR